MSDGRRGCCGQALRDADDVCRYVGRECVRRHVYNVMMSLLKFASLSLSLSDVGRIRCRVAVPQMQSMSIVDLYSA